jgi:crotonobetainyl-CoA:carnitine CoA-transferase CaiB-like acyl-CoA transferase
VSKPLPLQGIRVVEFSHMVMGPTCGVILGDLGADVIKVEPAEGGDNTRNLPGSGAGFFISLNRNKRSLALDVKKPRGLDLVRRLIARSDVVIENFRPGGLDAIGLSYESLKANNPGLIYTSLKGFLSGPYENRAALDEVVQMMGGLAYMTGPPGRPLRAGAPVNDMMGGMFAAIGILAALRERDQTGAGQHIKSSLYENTAFLVSTAMAQYAVTGKAAAPMPARISAWAVYDVFETADDLQVFIGVVTDTQWRAFCAAFKLDDLAADRSLDTNSQRVGARDRVMPKLRALVKGLTRADVSRVCERVNLPFAPILRPDELFDDAQMKAPGAMMEVTLADGRKTSIPALPLEMDGKRLGLRLDVPRIGQHSAVIAEEAGLDRDEIDALRRDGILRDSL